MSSILSFFTQTIGPLSIGQWLAVLALLAVVGYVVYDKFFKDEKKKDGHDHRHEKDDRGKGEEINQKQPEELNQEKEEINGILEKFETGNATPEELAFLKKTIDDKKISEDQLEKFNAIQTKNQKKGTIDEFLNKFSSNQIDQGEYEKLTKMIKDGKASEEQQKEYKKLTEDNAIARREIERKQAERIEEIQKRERENAERQKAADLERQKLQQPAPANTQSNHPNNSPAPQEFLALKKEKELYENEKKQILEENTRVKNNLDAINKENEKLKKEQTENLDKIKKETDKSTELTKKIQEYENRKGTVEQNTVTGNLNTFQQTEPKKEN